MVRRNSIIGNPFVIMKFTLPEFPACVEFTILVEAQDSGPRPGSGLPTRS